MKISVFSFIVTLVFFQNTSSAASYDCRQTTHPAEVTVCENFNLSVDDRVVSSLFQLNKSGTHLETLKSSQRAWLKQRDLCEVDLQCLRTSYKNRITELLSFATKQGNSFFTGPARPWQVESSKMLTALRLVHGVLENVDRHSLLPRLTGDDVEYFSNFWPNLIRYPGDETVDWREVRKPLDQNPLSENENANEQLSFGPGILVDYEGMSRCLKETRFSNFVWSGVSFSNPAVSVSGNCISFYFPSDWDQSNDEELYFPLVSSQLTYFRFSENNKLVDSQSCESLTARLKIDAKQVCQGNAYIAAIEYARVLHSSSTDSPYKFAIWLREISTSPNCRGCFELNLSKKLLQLARNRIAQTDNKPECFFDDDSIYTCRDAFGEARLKACVSGANVYQVSKSSEGTYELRFWANAARYLDNEKPKTTKGVLQSAGRLECSSQNFSFPKWAVRLGDTNECSTGDYPKALNNIGYVQCDRTTPYCGSKAGPMLCIGID